MYLDVLVGFSSQLIMRQVASRLTFYSSQLVDKQLQMAAALLHWAYYLDPCGQPLSQQPAASNRPAANQQPATQQSTATDSQPATQANQLASQRADIRGAGGRGEALRRRHAFIRVSVFTYVCKQCVRRCSHICICMCRCLHQRSPVDPTCINANVYVHDAA